MSAESVERFMVELASMSDAELERLYDAVIRQLRSRNAETTDALRVEVTSGIGVEITPPKRRRDERKQRPVTRLLRGEPISETVVRDRR